MVMNKISIDPITRLKGHGRIDLFLNEDGGLANAYLVIPELRGFEKFCEGRPVEEMPRITQRICGVCPLAHHMAAAKAGDAVRALYVRESTGRTFGEAFLTVFIDRLCDLGLVLGLGIISVILFSRYYIELPSAWLIFLSAAAIAVLVYLATNRRLMRNLLKPLFDLLVPQKYKEMFSLNFHTFYDSLGRYAKARKTMFIAFSLTVITWTGSPARAAVHAGRVAARVLPSPVAISATMPFSRTHPPISCTS